MADQPGRDCGHVSITPGLGAGASGAGGQEVGGRGGAAVRLLPATALLPSMLRCCCPHLQLGGQPRSTMSDDG